MGVDLAESAIRRARELHEDGSCRLRYLAADFCHEFLPYEGSFRIVVDRGCFHGVPVYNQNAYVRTLAAVTQEGSDYFLFHRVFRGPQPVDRTAERKAKTTEIESLFQRYFLIEQTHDTAMGVSDEGVLPGLFFRMRRNGRKR